MTTMLKDLPSFAVAEDILTYLSKAVNNKFNQAEPSADAQSDFMKLDAALRNILDARLALAAARLRNIDAEIAESGVIDAINAAAADAKKEADRIKRAAKVVNDIIKVVDEITSGVGLVGKLLAL